MKIPILNTDTIEQLRGFFHPKDRSVILADDTFIEGEEVATPANPRHNRGRLYWKNRCWTQLDEFGNETAFCSSWQDWTPTVNQAGAVAATVNFARYIARDGLIVAKAHLTVTGAGAAGTVITIGGLPLNAANTGYSSNGDGDWNLRDSSVPNNYAGTVVLVSNTTFRMRDSGTTGSGIGQVPNLALANGDTIGFTVIYEEA